MYVRFAITRIIRYSEQEVATASLRDIKEWWPVREGGSSCHSQRTCQDSAGHQLCQSPLCDVWGAMDSIACIFLHHHH